ncbi:hypothetical protein [Dokdonella sp.]|uniref:hypothetical protein n=1 Tax=Dokdonella sp. TaxID=2291710 RepID=UPI0025C49582|nr:hypothetical protein [Dokdonella sp.]MBX3693128.1 hypothetical protein [Dokdonella sp.]MCW5568246.1 hypothetical protein [Dokdonella sp.]
MRLFACLRDLANFDVGKPEQAGAVLEGCLSSLLDPVLWLWVSVLTLVCSGIGALIGWWKGRTLSGLVWATVLGPIGWIVMALKSTDPHACPHCAKANREFARTCRHCGAVLQAVVGEAPRHD